MNTSKISVFNKLKILSSTLILLVFISCSGQNENKNQTNNPKVETPKMDIHTAVMTSNLEVLKQHIAAGTNLNEKDPYGGSSPLITAALIGNTEATSLLLDAGADINFTNNDGSTALHTAAFFCKTEIVELLLKKGADKSIKNKFGSTAFESVNAPFADVKPVYDMMAPMLAPMGVTFDYTQLQTTRPIIANLLK